MTPENRQVLEPSSPSSPASPAKASAPKRLATPKAKAFLQANGVVEDARTEPAGGVAGVSSEANAQVQETKGVSLKPVRAVEGFAESWSADLEALGIDKSWLMPAVSSASDPMYALVDSGATNALRPAAGEEIEHARVIRVDLASGGTELHVNRHGTLLNRTPCQVILPAGYLGIRDCMEEERMRHQT